MKSIITAGFNSGLGNMYTNVSNTLRYYPKYPIRPL
jgi:hypothetical protein